MHSAQPKHEQATVENIKRVHKVRSDGHVRDPAEIATKPQGCVQIVRYVTKNKTKYLEMGFAKTSRCNVATDGIIDDFSAKVGRVIWSLDPSNSVFWPSLFVY